MSRSDLAGRVQRLDALVALLQGRTSSVATTTRQVFVFRPGGTAGGNVFTTWPALYAQFSQAQGTRWIDIDDSLDAAVVPSGTYNVDAAVFLSSGVTASALAFANGAHLTWNTLTVQNLDFETEGSTPVTSLANASAVLFCYGAAFANSGGDGFVSVGVAGTLVVEAYTTAFDGETFAGSDASSLLDLNLFNGSALAAGAVSSIGTFDLNLDGSSASAGLVSYVQTPVPTTVVLDPTPTFVFRPGGTASGNVYTTWASLMASVAQCPGVRTIFVDPTVGAAHATAGTWDLEACTLTSKWNSTNLLTVDDGSTWNFSRLTLDGIVVNGNANTPIVSAAVNTAIWLRGEASLSSSTATAFISQTLFSTDIFLSEESFLGDGTHPVINTAATKRVHVEVFEGSTVLAHALAGAGIANVDMDASGTVNATQDIGTVITTFFDVASQVAYTPATDGNWQPVPTLVNGALDQLAAPNFVQAQANTGTGTGTTSAVTGNIAKKRSGKVNVTGVVTGIPTSATTTIAVTLLRDATIIATLPAITVLSTVSYSVPISFVDTLPDAANHTYEVKAVAAAGNLTVGAAGNTIQAIEL